MSSVSPRPRSGSARPPAPANRRRRRLLLSLGAAAMLAACGKKGELELPPVEPAGADEQPADANR